MLSPIDYLEETIEAPVALTPGSHRAFHQTLLFDDDFRGPVRSGASLVLLETRARALLDAERRWSGERGRKLRQSLNVARGLARMENDRTGERTLSAALGILLIEQGMWEAAIDAFEAVRRTLPPLIEDAYCLYMLSQASIEIAPPSRALACCAHALLRIRGCRCLSLQARIRLFCVEIYRRAGDRIRAQRCLDRIHDHPASLNDAELRAWVRLAESDILKLAGRHDAALAACIEALDLGEGPPSTLLGSKDRLLLSALRRRAFLCYELSRHEEARLQVQNAAAHAGEDDTAETGLIRMLSGLLDLEEGNEDEAWSALHAAEANLRAARRTLDLANLLILRAELSATRQCDPGERSRAREGIFEARALFQRLGREKDVRRCEFALETFRSGSGAGGAPNGFPIRRPPRVPKVRRLSQLGFLTTDPRILATLEPLESLARTSIPVLILGESGTGKEVLARSLHRAAGCRGSFVAVNCGALPNELQESELFGHVRGAFTGAIADKMGLFEAADCGTLLLDEVGEMTPRAQVKLLRILELGEVRRVGETRTRRVHVRVIAATNADLKAQIECGAFRKDLYYRLCGLKLDLPPLRERMGDIPLLAAHFIRVFGDQDGAGFVLSPEALDRLLDHSWPGNVREMRFVMEKAVHLTRALGRSRVDADCIDIEPAISGPLRDAHGPVGEDAVQVMGLDAYIENVERRVILKALTENNWNRSRAARALGRMSRTTLIGKMKRLGLFPGPGAGEGNGSDMEE